MHRIGRDPEIGTPCGPHDMQIGGHARSEGLIVVTNNMREFVRMPGVRSENWLPDKITCQPHQRRQAGDAAANRALLW